ncbi:MAG: hypothetical protein IPL52_09960 [Flavobacteriales bacterium]|nr:hypothetical protein [Flavobacteriales bacterium]
MDALLAVWIINRLKDRSANRRTLKDHFIEEIKGIRAEYAKCLSNLYSSKSIAANVLPWFKLMNMKIDDVAKHVHRKYKIDRDKLRPYQIDLRELVTNNDDFVRHFNSGRPVVFTTQSKNELMMFQQSNVHLFNDIIISINDFD